MRIFFLSIVVLNTFFGALYGDDLEDADNAPISQMAQEPIFVSLGSVCEVAHALRACNLRKAAFPFDWITTIDSEGFLEILRDNFKYFLDEKCFKVADKGPGQILQTFYRLEFLHEGDFRGDLYAPTMQKLQTKYQRRIDRFRKLSEYKGKVFFLRTCYLHSMTDHHRYFFCADNLEITDKYSLELYSILKRFFPQLDFSLIIINNDSTGDLKEEKRLNSNLIKIRVNPHQEAAKKWDAYKKYFSFLIKESTQDLAMQIGY